MGQKTNPIGIRIGINKTWDSTWFDEKNYASKLHEDILIREFLNKKLSDASLAKIEVERTSKKISINFVEFCFFFDTLTLHVVVVSLCLGINFPLLLLKM